MKTSRFSSLLALATLACGIAAATVSTGCSTLAAAPTDSQVAMIKNACVADAIARPAVDTLVVLGGVATPAEAAGITAAREAIDTVCANPSGTIQDNALAVVTGASNQIAAIVAQVKARKAAAPPAAASSAS